jgi:uncharacterized membrane protein
VHNGLSNVAIINKWQAVWSSCSSHAGSFPTALFSAGFLFDLAGILLNEPKLFSASFYVILLGLASGLLAALFGLIDYIKLGSQPERFRVASWHGGIQFVVLMTFGVLAGLKFQAYPGIGAPGTWQLIVMGVILGAMLVGNFLGGERVFRYKVGIDEN